MLFGDAAKRQHRTTAGVREQHVEMPLFLLDLRIQRVEFTQPGRIDTHPRRLAACVADALHSRIEFGLTAAGEIDVCAYCREALRSSEADAAGCAGNECNLVVELACHGASP